VPAAFGFEIVDQRAIALLDAAVLAVVARRPFIAQRERTEAGRVGGVVTLDGARHGPPQPFVFRPGEMRPQEFGDRQVGFYRPQNLIEPARVRKRGLVGQQRSRALAPARASAPLQRDARFAHQGPRHRRRAVDKLGAALRRIAEFPNRQRIDAAAAAVARLDDRYPFAGAREFAGRHEARGARADDQYVRQIRTRRLGRYCRA